MNRFLHGVTRAVAETFALPAPVLEVGSFQVPGQDGIANLRVLFPGHEYLGVDVRPGPGVDQMADVQDLPFPDRSVGTVLAMNTFEHVPQFWRGLTEVYRVLRPDGVLLMSSPFYFHIHAYPNDYWRFTPEALKLMLADYRQLLIGWQGPSRKPIHTWAVAFREKFPPITPEQYEQYRQRVSRYARQPLALGRSLRYRLGRLLCGSRPFAPYLEQERWQTECRTTAAH